MLAGDAVTATDVRRWLAEDKPVLLLALASDSPLPVAVKRYLGTPEGREARRTYKCRNRPPWYVVPDVRVPHAFLTYMSSAEPLLVANRARCVGTNSVHTVNLTKWPLSTLQRAWANPFTSLSCEIEGHPLGGGVLKLEPGEAVRVALQSTQRWLSHEERSLIAWGVSTMREWRHYRGQEGRVAAANHEKWYYHATRCVEGSGSSPQGQRIHL